MEDEILNDLDFKMLFWNLPINVGLFIACKLKRTNPTYSRYERKVIRQTPE